MHIKEGRRLSRQYLSVLIFYVKLEGRRRRKGRLGGRLLARTKLSNARMSERDKNHNAKRTQLPKTFTKMVTLEVKLAYSMTSMNSLNHIKSDLLWRSFSDWLITNRDICVSRLSRWTVWTTVAEVSLYSRRASRRTRDVQKTTLMRHEVLQAFHEFRNRVNVMVNNMDVQEKHLACKEKFNKEIKSPHGWDILKRLSSGLPQKQI